MINKESEGKKLETELRHCHDEMIKVSEERVPYQKMLKVLTEEIRILQIENQKLRYPKLNLTNKFKLIKKLRTVIKAN
jgi:hypothetical protein